MMHRIRGSQNHASSRRKGQPNQSVACDFQAGFAFWCDLYNATPTRKRCGYIQVACRVKSEALRPSQAAVKRMHRPLRINSVHAVKARRGRSGHKQVSMRTEGEVVCRNARLESSEHEHLLVAANLEDRAAAVPDVEILIPIESDARSDSHPL